jgi:hypothetical protein
MIDPGEGRRESMAISSALAARSVRWALSVAQPMTQPMTRRLNTSITTQQ